MFEKQNVPTLVSLWHKNLKMHNYNELPYAPSKEMADSGTDIIFYTLNKYKWNQWYMLQAGLRLQD